MKDGSAFLEGCGGGGHRLVMADVEWTASVGRRPP